MKNEILRAAVREYLETSDAKYGEVDARTFFNNRDLGFDWVPLGLTGWGREIHLAVAFKDPKDGGLGVPPIRSGLGPSVAFDILPRYFEGEIKDLLLWGSQVEKPVSLRYDGGRWSVAEKGLLVPKS